MTEEFDRRLETIWRIESPRLIASLTRMVADVGIAEELAQDAFVAALAQWPKDGIPNKPGAWLTTTAKRRAIDRCRRDTMLDAHTRRLSRETPTAASIDADIEALDQNVGDDMLRLMFIACHPVLSKDARIALTLRLIGGLTTLEIARAFLVPEATIAQRIVRAKRTLSEARVPFELPAENQRMARVASILDVLYVIFNEGYTATSGAEVVRRTLCEEALRVARAMTHLAPDFGEAHALLALMELQYSRTAARANALGEPILLADQNRSLWDRASIRRGLRSLDRAGQLGDLGPFGIQAAIAACHARDAVRGNGLDAHQRPLRRTARSAADARRAIESCGGNRYGVRHRIRAAARRRTRTRADDARVPFAPGG